MDDKPENKPDEEHPQHSIELIAVLLMLEFLVVIFVISYPKTVVIQTQPAVPYESMMNLITWNSTNGYSSIQWNTLTELSIFHVWPNPNGSISYDGGLSNLASIISTAHSHGVKVFLAFGGDGVDPTVINNILANQTLQTIFINNLVNEVQTQNYDGLHVDFEGTFNQAQFTVFMQHLSAALWAKNPNYLIDVQIANWESSDFNLSQLEPYTTHFNVMYNPNLTQMNSWAAQLQNPSKMAAGYDFQDDPETPTILLPKLITIREAGYGMFFWQAAVANASYYSDIEQALAVGGSTTTSTLKSTTTAITSTSTSSTQTTSTVSAPPAKFTQGESVKVLYPTTLWATPSALTNIGTVAVGTVGTIVAQPQYNISAQLWFYDISFTTSQVGWIKETQLGISNATTTSSSTSLSTSTSSSTSSIAASTSSSATTILSSSTTAQSSTSASSSSAPTSSTSSSESTTTSSVPTTSTTVATTTTSTIGTISSTSATSTIPTTTISTTLHTTSSTSTSTSSLASTSSAPTTSSTTSSTTSTIPLAKFSDGEGIKTVYPTILWQTPTNSVELGTISVGTTGTIIAQPHFDSATQIWFYDVSFTTSQVGWIKETQVELENIITTTSSSTSTSSTAQTTSSSTTSSTSISTPTTSTSSSQATSASTTTITVPATSTTAPITSTSTIGTASSTSLTTTIPTTTISTTLHTTQTTSSSSSAPTSTSSSPTTSSPTTSQSTTSSTSTGSSTSSTSAPSTTISAIATSNSTVSVNGIISSNSPISVDVLSANTIVKVASNSPVQAKVTISNATGSASPLTNNNLLLAMSFNANEQFANVPLNASITTGYPCSILSDELGVFQLVNSTWNPISFGINSISCKVSYNITFDPVIGIFVQTKSNATTTLSVTTTINSGGPPAGGGGNGGGGAGGGAGSSKPVKTKTKKGYTITNVAQLNTFNITLANNTIKFVENYITPTSAGVTINNSSYVLNTTGNYVIGSGSNSIQVKLLNISYLPIEQTIALEVYSNQSTASPTPNSTLAKPLNITISATSLISAKVKPALLSNSVIITNDTISTAQAPSNYTKLFAIGITITAPGVPLANISVPYQCNVASNSIAPYVLNGSNWTAIKPFGVNSSSCYATFIAKSNSTVALMEFSAVKQIAPATTITGTTAAVAVSALTTKMVSKGLPNYIYIIAGIIILALIGVMLYVLFGRISGNSMISKRHVFLVYALVLMGAVVAIIYGYVAVHTINVAPTPPVLIQPNTTTTIAANASSTFIQEFQEFDLPMGTNWSVMFGNNLTNGSTKSGTANMRSGYLNYSTGFINFTISPGGYYYTIKQVPGYNLIGYPLRDQGYINTSQQYDLEGIPTSKGQVLQGIFVQCTSSCNSTEQTLTFERFGLPDASNWSVTVDNTTNSSSSYFINFTESVGIHNYSIGDIKGYIAYPAQGTVNLTKGSSIYSVAIAFAK